MTQPELAEKKCPDCGGRVGATASLCRHCGYVFPVGKPARTMPSQLTQDKTDGIAVEVRAAAGRCLINLPGQSPSGLRARLAGKLTAFTIK